MKEAVAALPWVESYELDFENKRLTLTVDEDWDPDATLAAIRDLGFGAELVES